VTTKRLAGEMNQWRGGGVPLISLTRLPLREKQGQKSIPKVASCGVDLKSHAFKKLKKER